MINIERRGSGSGERARWKWGGELRRRGEGLDRWLAEQRGAKIRRWGRSCGDMGEG